jgi:lysophospholipase L1-like esterase
MIWYEIIVLTCLIVCIFEIVWFGTRIMRAIRAGKIAIPAAQEVSSSSARLLVIGDSTSYGSGASQPSFSLVGRLAQDFPQFTIVNASENAMSLAQVRKKMETISTRERFDIIMIHVGGIDTLLFTPISIIQKELHQIFSLARAMGAQTVVLVSVNNVGSVPLFHFPFNHLFTHRSRLVSEACDKESLLNDIVHVPLFSETAFEPLLRNGHQFFSVDGIHPNDEGYGVWYEKIRTTVSPYFVTKSEHV